MHVLLPEIVAMDLYRHGFIEPDLTSVLLGVLQPGIVVVDVGAQYGYYSLLAAPLIAPTGLVFAFEPGRRALPFLQRNLAGLPNVHIESAAVSAAAGKRVLHDFGARHSALSSLRPEARTPVSERAGLRAERYEVESVSLDDYFGRLGLLPDVVKVDAESSELEVLRGMEGILRSGAPLVSIEVGDYEVTGAEPSSSCIDFLESVGYVGYEYVGGHLVPHRRRSRYTYGNLYFRKRAAAPVGI